MINNELKRTLNVLNYISSDDAIDIIMNPSTQIEPEYLDPFNEELNMQLLTTDSLVQKRSLIKLYIFEFRHIQELYIDYKEILLKKNGYLFEISSDEYDYESYEGERRKLSLIENYIVNSYELFRLTFDVIQLCCIREQIDFIALCNEINFTLDFIDIEISEEFHKKSFDYLSLDPVEEKLQYFKSKLVQNGFFNLPKVEKLQNNSKEILIRKIFMNELAYSIAMFNFLDYFKYLDNLFKKRLWLHKELSKWFSQDERSIRGCINVLTSISKENTNVYKTLNYKEIVENDYIIIKSGEFPLKSP